jgi:hypothetical protein
LTLTSTGTGQAIFQTSGTTTLTISGSQVVTVTGIAVSSVSNDILLQVRPQRGGPPAVQNISVVTVQIMLSPLYAQTAGDNSAAVNTTNVTNLGSVLGPETFYPGFPDPLFASCGVFVQLVGMVTPNDYVYPIELHRRWVSEGLFAGVNGTQHLHQSEAVPGSDDTSLPRYRDDLPQSDGSVGKVYDIDAPEKAVFPSEITRIRDNFHEYAVFPGSTKELGLGLDYYVRLSCTTTSAYGLNAQFVTSSTSHFGVPAGYHWRSKIQSLRQISRIKPCLRDFRFAR